MIDLAVSTRPVREVDLVGGEIAVRAQIATLPKARDWRLGRGALKQLLGKNFDTTTLNFPHPRLSLTHAGGIAIAARSMDRPIGIDFEPIREMNPRATHLYLSPKERSEVGVEDWLRLWTVKEAIFKCDHGNRGRWLGGYRIETPRASRGRAVRDDAEYHYASVEVFDGWLTLAMGDKT